MLLLKILMCTRKDFNKLSKTGARGLKTVLQPWYRVSFYHETKILPTKTKQQFKKIY